METLVSKNTNTLKIKEFKQFYSIINTTQIDDIDNQLLQMSIITGLSIDELENLDLDEYKAIGQKAYETFNVDLNTSLIKSIMIDGQEYGVSLKDNGDAKITLKDIQTIKAKVDVTDELNFINNLDLFAAILFKPIINGKVIDDDSLIERAQIFNENMNIEVVYPYMLKVVEKLK